jgi:hypothetical protein
VGSFSASESLTGTDSYLKTGIAVTCPVYQAVIGNLPKPDFAGMIEEH